MKQYKFKYKGKWHDILCTPCGKFKGEAIADTCFGTPDEYHFRVLESSLPKLLATLRKLNIEVAEVCDKLKWRNGESNIVLRFSSGCFERVFYKIQDGYAEIVRCSSNRRGFVSAHDPSSIKGLKAACQADFQKRRAR